jgi:hypothetical protein
MVTRHTIELVVIPLGRKFWETFFGVRQESSALRSEEIHPSERGNRGCDDKAKSQNLRLDGDRESNAGAERPEWQCASHALECSSQVVAHAAIVAEGGGLADALAGL